MSRWWPLSCASGRRYDLILFSVRSYYVIVSFLTLSLNIRWAI